MAEIEREEEREKVPVPVRKRKQKVEEEPPQKPLESEEPEVLPRRWRTY